MMSEINDPQHMVRCSYCGKEVRVADALQAGHVIAQVVSDPAQGVYIFDSKICQEKHMIARKVQPIVQRLPPVERDAQGRPV